MRSLRAVWIWWSMGLASYVPVLIFPMLVTWSVFGTTAQTIVSGTVTLASHQALPLALVIAFASVVIPLIKLLAIAYLAHGIQTGAQWSARQRYILYEMIEFIGRWSMIDVFVVAVLSAAIQVRFVVSVSPGVAAICFACSVLCTMRAAQCLDTRLIWSRAFTDVDHASHSKEQVQSGEGHD